MSDGALIVEEIRQFEEVLVIETLVNDSSIIVKETDEGLVEIFDFCEVDLVYRLKIGWAVSKVAEVKITAIGRTSLNVTTSEVASLQGPP